MPLNGITRIFILSDEQQDTRMTLQIKTAIPHKSKIAVLIITYLEGIFLTSLIPYVITSIG